MERRFVPSHQAKSFKNMLRRVQITSLSSPNNAVSQSKRSSFGFSTSKKVAENRRRGAEKAKQTRLKNKKKRD